jgi:hypothetical protein
VRSGREDLVDLGWAALLAGAILVPLFLGAGFWVIGDMVFVPEQPWKPAWLGLDGSLPRAVPMDALVSVATQVVPGAWVQRGLLAGGLVLGGLGMGRLTRGHAWYARAAAITLLVWNPWVHERLLIGQWAILLGYLTLPWVALAARQLRAAPGRGWAPAVVAVTAAAVCSPSTGVMAAVTFAALGLSRDRRTWWRWGVVTLGANLTWAVPALLADARVVTGDEVFAGFAARAESAAGVLASLWSLGGIWKISIVPPERAHVVVIALSCLLSLAAAAGLWRLRRTRPDEWWRWVVLGAGALVVAVVPTVPAGLALLERLAGAVPPVALLRDSHRFLAPLGLVLAVGMAGSVTWVRERLRPGREAVWGAIGLMVVAPVLLLPSLAWGGGGELQRAHYPEEWHDVADLLSDEPGTVVVLPWRGSYRGYEWNHRRATLDPAPRYFPGRVVIDDRVLLDDRTIASEDPLVRRVGRALATSDTEAALRSVGVRWVLLEKGMAADRSAPDPLPGVVRHRGDELELRELTGPVAPVDRPAPVRVGTILVGHIATGTLLFVAVAAILRRRCCGRHN